LKLEVLKEADRTPLIFAEVDATDEGDKRTLFMYGHFDKQPPFEGWREGLSATNPVREGNKLYGRGGADDGYSIYTLLLSIKALQVHGIPHSRCTILIEGAEESMSVDLPFYVD
jgi:acetylornithine deacetylase/succinyl-diaminopimelate desuccinylase-like protein